MMNRKSPGYLETEWLQQELTKARSIIISIAKQHGLTLKQIRSPNRKAALVRVRQEAFYRTYQETQLGRQVLAKLFHRDKQTLFHGIRQHEKRNAAP